MKKKLNLFRKRFPEQVVKPQVDKLEITKEEKKKKKCIIDGIKRSKKGLTISVIAVVLLFISCEYSQDNAYDGFELQDNLGYEDMQDEKDDGTVHVLEKPIIKEEENKPSEEIKNNEGNNTNKEETSSPMVESEELSSLMVVESEKLHEHVYSSTVVMNDAYEKRICACGAVKVVAHEFVREDVYKYEDDDQHSEKIMMTCRACGYYSEAGRLEECKYTIIDYNDGCELVRCDECAHIATRMHELDKGSRDETTDMLVRKHCIHEGCDYSKVVKLTDNPRARAVTNFDSVYSEKCQSVQDKIKSLHAMKEIVINGTVFEYPEPEQQHVLKKMKS